MMRSTLTDASGFPLHFHAACCILRHCAYPAMRISDQPGRRVGPMAVAGHGLDWRAAVRACRGPLGDRAAAVGAISRIAGLDGHRGEWRRFIIAPSFGDRNQAALFACRTSGEIASITTLAPKRCIAVSAIEANFDHWISQHTLFGNGLRPFKLRPAAGTHLRFSVQFRIALWALVATVEGHRCHDADWTKGSAKDCALPGGSLCFSNRTAEQCEGNNGATDNQQEDGQRVHDTTFVMRGNTACRESTDKNRCSGIADCNRLQHYTTAPGQLPTADRAEPQAVTTCQDARCRGQRNVRYDGAQESENSRAGQSRPLPRPP